MRRVTTRSGRGRSRSGSHSVLAAGLSEWPDNVAVLGNVRCALHLLEQLLALSRRRIKEVLQPSLRQGRCIELGCNLRKLVIHCRNHLRVIACGVDDWICECDSSTSGQRQCQTANRGSQCGQRQCDH